MSDNGRGMRDGGKFVLRGNRWCDLVLLDGHTKKDPYRLLPLPC